MRPTVPIKTSSLSLPPDTFIYSIVPVRTCFAAISSDDSLRLFDPESLELISNGCWNAPHTGLTCLKRTDYEPNAVFTAGRNGVVSCWDVRERGKTFELTHEKRPPVLSLAISTQKSLVATGTELTSSQAVLSLWDYRAQKIPVSSYSESHNDDITELQFHPFRPSCLLSGSTDGLINIYDITISDEDDALIQVMNHGASISHANFLSDNELYALSHDESFSIYLLDTSSEESSCATPRPFGDLRVKAECEYIVDVLPFDGGAVIGAGTHSECRLDLLPLSASPEWAFRNSENETIRILEAHGNEIVRSIHIDYPSSTIYSAGEDGLVKTWKTVEPDRGECSQETSKTKRKKETSLRSERYKPY